jgi:hypothetical protein
MHNRRGSVLLMAIGMLTILSILTSTFLVISSLDSEETESLAVRAYADPVLDGLVAKAVAQISFDRQVNTTTPPTYVPYGAMPATSNGLVSFMDYPHAYVYGDTDERTDHWLSSAYVPGEGITGQLTNLEGPAKKAAYADLKFKEGTTYKNGQDGNCVDTDCDGIPDAVLYNTNISSPLIDANSYWAAVRIVDLGARICVNTAGGRTTNVNDTVYSSDPIAVDLRGFLNENLYTLLHGSVSGNALKGRLGDVTGTTGGTAVDPAPASLIGYDKYCARNLLSPTKPSSGGTYQPFGIGDEAFFLNACVYRDNLSQFGGRLHDMLSPASAPPMSDQFRRQLTTMSSVSSIARWPDLTATPKITEPLVLRSVQTRGDCQLVYERMKVMLRETGVGIDAAGRSRMAASFAANLWAYCSNGTTGEPWAFPFTPEGGSSSIAYGLRQRAVITEVFARHIVNTKFDANDKTKDDSAWGFAVEISNPSFNTARMGDYELVMKPEGLGAVTISLGSSSLLAASANATAPKKMVVYGYGKGPACTDTTGAVLFGSSPSWTRDDKLNFLTGKTSLSLTLYYKAASGEKVPVDYVSVGDNTATFDLVYNTSRQLKDIAGDYTNKIAPTAENKCIYIKRDDRLKTAAGYRVARYNMAIYAESPPGTQDGANAYLGKDNNITEGDLKRRSNYGAPSNPTIDASPVDYSPGISRPRDKQLSVSTDYLPSQDDYFLPSLADLCNIFLTGPITDGGVDLPFTTQILRKDMSCVFKNRPDIGRIPSAKPKGDVTSLTDMVDVPPGTVNMKYPDVPPGYLFHEFFTRTPSHPARPTEKKRTYGLFNINTAAIGPTPSSSLAAWWLPWPAENSSNNRLGLGQMLTGGKTYVRGEALKAIREYRDRTGDYTNRATSTGITGLRIAGGVNGSDIAGFTTPGEVGIPLAKYMDTLLGSAGDCEKDTDYIRARNCLFGYISDCLSTRSDVYACYITVQHSKSDSGRRWRYVAVIDRSNVMTPTDKAAVILLSQLR